jgi:hypothetical protein
LRIPYICFEKKRKGKERKGKERKGKERKRELQEGTMKRI